MADKAGIIEGVLGAGEAGEAGAAAGLDPIAAALAAAKAARGRPLDPQLAAYLARQERLVELQTEDLLRQGDLQLAHLRVRRWKDRLSLMLQGLGVALAAAVVVALAVLAWQAHEDHGLVIQAFTAPPAFAARGVTGEAVAADVLGKLSTMVAYVRENSMSSTGAVSTDTSSDVKIEIPETGVSLSEVGRLLRAWLGSARKVSGGLRDDGDGRVTLTARLDTGETFQASGAAADLGALEQTIAEQVYGATDPNNLPIYLVDHGRKADAFAAAVRYAARPQDRQDRANAVTLRGDLCDDPACELRYARIALRLDPGLLAGRLDVALADLALEHPGDALSQARSMLSAKAADQPRQHRGAGAAQMLGFARTTIDDLLGDYAAAVTDRAAYDPNASARSRLLLDNATDLALRHDPAASLDLIAEAQVFGPVEPWRERLARHAAAAAREDWAATLAEAQALVDLDQAALAVAADPDAGAGLKVSLERRDRPMLAIARARTGDLAGATALVASTPIDCYGCLRARGTVAALGGGRPEAERWFAAAIRQAPGLPLAYVDRGRARLDWGDIAGALSDAATAHRLGPHDADALKLRGDVLARQGRWSAAAASYDAALAQAPAWTALKRARAVAGRHAG